MIFPTLERMGKPLDLVLPFHYSEVGIPRLLEILDLGTTYHFCTDRSFKKVIRQTGATCMMIRHRDGVWSDRSLLRLSRAAIERVVPLEDSEDFIVVHPVSIGVERHYARWEEVDFTGLNIRRVGAWSDPVHLGVPWFRGDFYQVAGLLRSPRCRGLLCVESCVMNLANVLGVPSVTIYPSRPHSIVTPCLGVALVNPTPEEVGTCARELLDGGCISVEEALAIPSLQQLSGLPPHYAKWILDGLLDLDI